VLAAAGTEDSKPTLQERWREFQKTYYVVVKGILQHGAEVKTSMERTWMTGLMD
jgi:hypothetical protein